MKTIDLNCDMGEGFGRYSVGMDEGVMRHISSANIACGWHAGDPRVMNATVSAAKDYGIGIGAHPGYPDLMGFGRRHMDLSPVEIRDSLIYQIGALQAFCQVHRVSLQHVKPHGALYLDAMKDSKIARAVAQAVASLDPQLRLVVLAGQGGDDISRIGAEMGLCVVREAFPDRAYTSGGTLMPRSSPGALITDPATVARRALDMAQGFVLAEDGRPIDLDVQTLCVHGDSQAAVALVQGIRARLEAEGISVVAMGA